MKNNKNISLTSKQSIGKMVVIVLLFLCGHVVSKYFLYIAIIYIILAFLKQENVENYYLGLFLISNIRVMDSLGVSYVINILLAIPLFKYIIEKKGGFDTTIVIGWLLLFIWELFHIFVYENYSNAPNEISTFLGMLYCITITLNLHEELDYKKAWSYFTFGIISSGVLFLCTNLSYLQETAKKITMGERFCGYAGEPNYYALYICLSLSMIFIFNEYTLVDYISMCALIVFGIMTASKMCVLLMLFIIVIGIVHCIRSSSSRSKKEFVFLGILIMTLGGVLFRKQLDVFIGNFTKRAGILGDGIDFDRFTSDRSLIISNYITILSNDFESLIVGKGMQYHLFFSGNLGYGSHNTYFDAVLAWGLLGASVLLAIIVYWKKKFMDETKIKKGFNIPIIVLMINLLDLSCLSATMFWWVLSFAMLSLKYNNSAKINNESTSL